MIMLRWGFDGEVECMFFKGFWYLFCDKRGDVYNCGVVVIVEDSCFWE